MYCYKKQLSELIRKVLTIKRNFVYNKIVIRHTEDSLYVPFEVPFVFVHWLR